MKDGRGRREEKEKVRYVGEGWGEEKVKERDG